MRICVAQTKSEKGNIKSNIENHKKWIDIAVSEKADLIIFPELSLTGYEPELANELATDQSDSRLNEFQKNSDLNRITIGVGLPTKSESGIFISMVIFQPDRLRQTYSKQELHSDELPYFIEGSKQIILTIKNRKIALAICHESFLPQHSQNANELGAEFYLASVAKSQTGIEKAFAYFPKLAAGYSIQVLMSNCVGSCDNFESMGHTAVWDEKGTLKCHLGSQNEGILVYDTSTKRVNRVESNMRKDV